MAGVAGKIVVCFNTRRTGLTTGAQRLKAAEARQLSLGLADQVAAKK